MEFILNHDIYDKDNESNLLYGDGFLLVNNQSGEQLLQKR